MAQALFDALSGGPGPGDNQTALAVQSLLESQNVGETSQAEDDDIFQCGRCKKQFTSLPAFVSHKQGRCAPLGTPPLRPANQPAANSVGVAFTTSTPLPSLTNRQQPVVTYSTVPPSPLTQLTQGMVLSDDLMTLNPMEQSLQPVSTVQMQNTTVQANPFLPQVAPPPVPVPCNAQNVTLFGNVNAANQLNTNTNSSIFTSAPMVNNQIPVQNMTQQITMTTCDRICSTDGMKATNAPSGKKVVQNNIITFVPEMDVRVLKSRRAKDPNILNLDDGSNKKKLHCQYCDKSFAKNFDLQQHVRSHTGEKPFQCIVCGRAFAQKSNVKKHMATHKVWPSGMGTTLPRQPSPQPVSSDQDMDTADTPADAEQEVNTHITAHSVPSLVTTASQIELQQLQQLEAKPIESEDLQDPQDHLIQNSSEATLDADGKLNVVVDNSYLCQYCPEKFKSYFQLKSHMVQHKSEQVYKCVVKACGSTFKDLESFLSHTKGHEEDMSYRCHICSKHFATLYELGVHQYSHSNYQSKSLNRNGPRHFQCTKCLNKYSTPEALEHHLSTTSHSYSCPHCKKIFPCERYLRRHLPTHGTIGQFQCLTCQKRFKTEHYLKMHSLIHSGEKPFQCEMCQAAFNRKDKLKRHLLIHETVKKYKCPFRSFTGCTKEFNRPDKLKAHIITHSGIKPFKCKECGKGFSRRPHLVEHERGHRADYKFKCQKCGRGFFRPKLFKEHKCHPLKEGAEPPVFRPRHRRKLGRPRKRMITITPDMLKHSSERDQRRRGRPRGAASRAQQKAAAANSGTTAVVTEGESTVPVEAVPCTAFTCQNAGNPADILTADDLAQVSDTRTALHPQTTPSAVPLQPVDQPLNPGELGSKTSDAVIDHYVVHFTESTDSSGMTIHAQLIPAFPASSVISGTPTLQPITIIEAQPVQVSVPVTDAVSSAPVIVAPAGGAPQHYVPAAASMEEYATTEGHPALQSAAENLLKGPDTVL